MDTLLEVLATGGRGVCPECHGGTQQERCLKVWQHEGIVYGKCYRNSCGKKFRRVTGAQVEVQERERPVIQYRTHVGCPKALDVLNRTNGLEGSPSPCSVQEREGLVYKLLGPDRSFKGWSVRFYDGRTPKSLNVYHETAPGKRELGWFVNVKQASVKPLLIVEDCLSALLASRYLPSVALCGTVLSLDNFLDIINREGINFNGDVIFALDRDAYTRSLMYGQMFSSLCRTHVLNLAKDIKDLQDNEIQELLNEHCE